MPKLNFNFSEAGRDARTEYEILWRRYPSLSFINGEILLPVAPAEPSCFAAHPMRVKCAAEAEVFQGWWHHFIRAWLALSVCPSAKSSNRPNEGEGRKGERKKYLLVDQWTVQKRLT